MPDPVVPIGLAKDWIAQLWQLWSTLREQRREELRQIHNVFGDPELLAQTYIEPDCQLTNPADLHEEEPWRVFRQPVREWLNGFLQGEFFERDGRNTLFVLSDAGMGKSSLLLMLRLSHMLSFWPSELDFRLLKLGPRTLEEIAAVRRRGKTVLLLDALDEDSKAWGRIEDRVMELLHETRAFRQVILTCRTQFFPKAGRAPVEKPEKVEIAGFVCNLVYLSPFSERQVEEYLRKVYPDTWSDRLRKLVTRQDNPRFDKARRLVLPMQSLRMRPMLLAYVDELMEAEIEDWSEIEVYRALVEHWLLREQRKQPGGPRKEELLQACLAVALHLQASGERVLSAAQLDGLLARAPVAEHIRGLDVGGRSLLNRTSEGGFRFAHYSIQEFLVAHSLIAEELPPPAAPVKATDQIVAFLGSWLEVAPQERLPRVRWRGLDFSGVEVGARLAGARWEKHGIELVHVPGGEYELGAEDLEPVKGAPEEYWDWPKPIHRVQLSSFWIAVHPVTNAQYARFLGARPAQRKPEEWDNKRFNAPEQPVVGVSWQEARAFCEWAGFELPSEAQWEAAARGTDQRRYPWGDEEPTPQLVSFGGNWEKGQPSPVGLHPAGAGPFGTQDQAGNVWEWCEDAFQEEAYAGRDGQRNPVLTADDGDETVLRVVRGGAWGDPARDLRAAFRGGYRAWSRVRFLGFRVVFRSGPEP